MIKRIQEYRKKIKKLQEMEQELIEVIGSDVWDMYHRLQQEIESDKSVIQKEIKAGKETVEVDGLKFKMSTRTRTSIPDKFMFTALDLGHLDKLVDLGVITGVKVNEDMIERLPPELSGIYGNLIEKTEYSALTWPKKADR